MTAARKNLSPRVNNAVFFSAMSQPLLSTLTDGTVVIRGVDRTIFGPRDRRMLRASLSSALKMRQRNAAFAETPQAARRRQARLAIDLAISNVFGIEGKALWRGTRGVRDIAEARQVAMYLAHVCCRMLLTEVGAMFGRDRTTVAHACLKVEYRRDDPNFDRARRSGLGIADARDARSKPIRTETSGRNRASGMDVSSSRERKVTSRQGLETPERNFAESPLAWLARRKDKDGQPMLTDAEFDAGEKLRADFWFAQMTPRVTANWSLLLTGGGGERGAPDIGPDIRDSVVAAHERVKRALTAVGPDLAGVLIDVCCHLKGLEASEKASGWPQRQNHPADRAPPARPALSSGRGREQRQTGASPALGRGRLSPADRTGGHLT